MFIILLVLHVIQWFCVLSLSTEKCEYTVNNTIIEKSIGDTWNSTVDPCLKYTCEQNVNGSVFLRTYREYCYLTCNNEFELVTQKGQCCGDCVQTKCKFNNSIYDIGSMWKSVDGCSFYECTKTEIGIKVWSYKKSCPPLMDNCPDDKIGIKDCCRYCRYENSTNQEKINERNKNDFIFAEGKYHSIMDRKTYENHICRRKCVENSSMICNYTFLVEWYETLSKACYDCPYNQTDCYRPHCIYADGVRRSILVINRMMPGPKLEVCFGDTINVDVINSLIGESTTIHWHGMHQTDTPYMDGVPHVTQCAIAPETTFRYTFKADNEGTHWWHSHAGLQRSDGAFGALIVNKPTNQLPPQVPTNLKEHLIFVQDWHHTTGIDGFNAFHHSIGSNKPTNLLINGKGKFINTDGEGEPFEIITVAEKDEKLSSKILTNSHTSVADTSATITSTTSTTNVPSNVEQNQIFMRTLQDINDNRTNFIEIKTNNAPTVQSDGNETEKIEKSNRRRRDTELVTTPLEVFEVSYGETYKFRTINAGFLNCPVEISIDNHNLTIISSDGYYIEQVNISTLVTYAGERFDFLLEANQTIGNYWIRIRGLMDCDERFTSAHQVAILRYEGAKIEEPADIPVYDYIRDGIQLNPLNRGTGYNDSINIAELSALDEDDKLLLAENTDYKFYIYYDFYNRDNPHFNDPLFYSIHSVPNVENKFFGPQLNMISMKMQPVPFLLNKNHADDSKFCNATSLLEKGIDCKKDFCECSHILQVPLNASVEVVIVDEGYKYDANHPFHLHGHGFRVIGMERIKPEGISIDEVQEMDSKGLLKRRLKNAPIKDTVTVPDGGYTIIRFAARNPGYWLFHCHIDYHIEVGMALVFKVGESHQMPTIPKNFPKCYNYLPSAIDKSTVPDSSDRPRLFLGAVLTIVILLFI